MNDRNTSHQPVEHRVSFLLQAVAGELSALHGGMQNLQETLVELASRFPGCEDNWSEFQEVDRITQMLSELSFFLTALSANLPSALVADVGCAASRVALHDLQQCLLGKRREEMADADRIELF